MLCFELEQPTDAADIETLLDTVFGPDRLSKSSYALRENNPPLPELSVLVRFGDELVASIRFSKTHIAGSKGAISRFLLLGPLAVKPELHGQGVGKQLIEHSLKSAANMGMNNILLVGDESYYGRFGFVPAMPNSIRMLGDKVAERLLLRMPRQMGNAGKVGEAQSIPHGDLLPGWP
ncbi:MAG: N-acetyltransferase [Kordiimonadaceae bacterium]|nr:N-acetyltransferase [Kordiimonadaceae bacterium]